MKKTPKPVRTNSINVNDHVMVKLTDYGRNKHREHHRRVFGEGSEKLFPYNPPEEDAEGWSEWTLRSLMKTFGSILYQGNPDIPFEKLEIRIQEAR